MKQFKLSIFALFMLVSQGAFSSNRLPFACLSFENKNFVNREIDQALEQAAAQIRSSHPELANNGVGFGRCLNLPETSVLAVASQKVLNFPEECLGLTFLAFNQADLIEKASKTLQVKNALIDGANGAAFIVVRGKKIKVPICMESFEGGGPQ